MKLYYAPGACSMASHIVLAESGVPFSITRVDLRNKTTEAGEDYTKINPKGYVPCVRLDNGAIIGENTALLAYLGELRPTAGLMPPAGTIENYRVREWLGFVSSELHKNCSPFFRPNTPEATLQAQRELLRSRLTYVEGELAGKEYLTGNAFTAADAYMFTVLSWFGHVGIDLAAWPNIQAYQARIAARAAVKQVMKDEGLLKAA